MKGKKLWCEILRWCELLFSSGLWNLDSILDQRNMVKTSSEKMGLKKGTWSREEDEILASYIQRFGVETWRMLPQKAGLLRCGKSCRFRWLKYLRPGIKLGNFSKEEEEIIISLHKQLGNRWSEIAQKLPGRTDNEIKNYWHTHLKKRSNEKQEMEETETQPSIGRRESKAYKQLLISEDPSSDQMFPQSLSNNFMVISGSSCTMSKAPTEVVADEFKQSTIATEVDGRFSSQSLLEEIFSPQESFLSTFEGLGLQFPLSPPSFVQYDYLGAHCNTELDISFPFFEGGEQPDC